MASKNTIPDIVIGRLPVYLRSLQRMLAEGRQVTSSQELGERLGISAAQIRKDLSQFGEFGKQGTGYNVEFLEKQIEEILHVDRVWEMAVIGAGDVGHALASYNGFHLRGFEVVMLFDNDPGKIGERINGFTVKDIDIGVGYFPVHQQWHAYCFHGLQRGVGLADVGDAGIRVGGGSGRVELDGVDHTALACIEDFRCFGIVGEIQRHQRLESGVGGQSGENSLPVGQGRFGVGHRRLQVWHDDGPPELTRCVGYHGLQRFAVPNMQVPVIWLVNRQLHVGDSSRFWLISRRFYGSSWHSFALT